MTEQESNSLQKSLTAALLKASGDEPANTAKPTPAERSKANTRRIHAESGLECPSCGYEGPESEFSEVELDSDSDGFETDSETSRTDGDDPAEAKLAKEILKSAQLSDMKHQPLHETRRDEPALTKEAAAELIAKALKSMRR